MTGDQPQLDQLDHIQPSLRDRLAELRPLLAAAAQRVYDEWEQDDDGVDVELGTGGICSLIANALQDVVIEHLPDISLAQAGSDDSEHDWFFVLSRATGEAVEVDIPYGIYERGGIYSWRKIADVVFQPEDVLVEPYPFAELARDLDQDPDFEW